VGIFGKKLGTAYYSSTHQVQIVEWRLCGIVSVVSNKHLGEEISKGTHLKIG
jgi:hypothetical protein